MTAEVDARSARRARTLSLRHLPGLMREPLETFERLGSEASGEIVRVNLGVSRPYLVTRPEHVQRVLRDNAENYPREGMMWKPLTRLVGGIAGEGPEWALNRGIFQRLMSGPNIASVTGEMARTIAEAVDELTGRLAGRPGDSQAEMTRIVQRAIIRVFFGNRISLDEADHLADAIRTATRSIGFRMLMPFVPLSVPLPGDRAFQAAVRSVDEVIFPLVEEARRGELAERDIVSMLIETRDEQGRRLNDQQVRDGVVAMFTAGTETTATALTWLWVVLKEHPAVADKVYAEIDAVLGQDRPDRTHLPRLQYTKMVIQELLRMYSVGWIIPRTSVDDDVIDGVRIKGGSTIVISPYLTHRVADVWPDPEVFDPDRFSPTRSKGRHRFAYMAFGAGPHQCVGTLFFTVEAHLIASTLLQGFRPVVQNESPVRPQVRLTLIPRERVDIVLNPASHR
ncbi:cytochrome P450 [Actinomadura soli]|uniref:Cytochrome P450 n=1 Tax=Actinomadura soli TaxID=2508997 RepID=A0A5C4JHV0_9ACTN|nr:cytochrome P450 [Actinomadura soli]TMR06264.1 cytochrome P450 [Actinomadura soli]